MRLEGLFRCAVPAKVSLPTRSAEFVDITDADLLIPSFDYAIARLGKRCEVDLASLPELVAVEQLGAPRGIIFHSTRCGSTLAANMLGTHPGFRVIKEPNAINQFLLQMREDAAGILRDEWFSALVRSYGRGVTTDQGVVIKLSGWTMPFAEYMMRQLPEVPAIFLWRAAEPVVMSCLAQQPAWTELRNEFSLGRELFGEWQADADILGHLSMVAFYAHAWLSFARHGADLARRHHRVTVINYDDMTRSYEDFVAAMAMKFGVTPTEPDIQRMLGATSSYAKSFVRDVPFDPFGAHARPRLSDAAREVVGSICAGGEAVLRGITTPASSAVGW
jgi:hypothetical protein